MEQLFITPAIVVNAGMNVINLSVLVKAKFQIAFSNAAGVIGRG
jgi:hypothetical protein